MKNFTKLLTAVAGAAICAMVMVVPAKAATAEDLANQARWQQDQVNHAAVVASQVAYNQKKDAENYAYYLARVVDNKKETERIKKEIVTNYTELAKVNPSFGNLIPDAQKVYESAANDTAIAQAAADAAKAAAAAMK